MFQIDQKTQAPFSFYAQVTKAYDAPNGNWVIEGPLSNPGEDLQKEIMQVPGLVKGLEACFDKLGQPVDWDHLWERTRDPDYLIGKGVERFMADHPNTGHSVPFLRAELFPEKEYAQKAKRHYDATKGKGLGFSVAGVVSSRDPINKNIIVEPMITSVAVTPVPVVSENLGCVSFVKSLAEAASRGPAGIRDIRFPIVPETRHLVLPLFDYTLKALDVSPGLPHEGPGGSALAVEDIDGARQKRRKKLRELIGLAITARMVGNKSGSR